jgi:hypothetical protein
MFRFDTYKAFKASLKEIEKNKMEYVDLHSKTQFDIFKHRTNEIKDAFLMNKKNHTLNNQPHIAASTYHDL